MGVKPGYKRTAVGVIPEEWEVSSLADVTETSRPISYGIVQTGQNVPNGIPCIRVVDIDDGRISTDDLVRTSKEISDSYRRTVLRARDLVMPLRGKVGDVAEVDSNLDGANLTRGVALISVQRHLSSSYFRHALSSPKARRRLEQSMNGSALQEIPIAALRSFQIAHPASLEEQRAIATALSVVDALLTQLDRLIAKKRDVKQATMQQLLTGKTRLPGCSGEWLSVKAGEIGRFRGGSGFPTKFQGNGTGTLPFYKVSDMNTPGNEVFMSHANNYIGSEIRAKLSATVFPPMTIVFAKVGAAIFLERKKLLRFASCLDNNMAGYVPEPGITDPRYLHYVFMSTALSDLVSTTALPSLNNRVLASMILRLPPIEEQTAIATLLSDLDAELAALEARRDKTRALKQGMMQELLTGRTRLA